MANYNNIGLVNHCKAALQLKTKYMWGGVLKSITKSYINALRSIYGNQSGTGYDPPRYAMLENLAKIGGYYGCDCVGLIKSYYWSRNAGSGGTGSPNAYKPGYPPDVNATTMYNNAKEKGPINTLPEIPGVILYCRSHPHVGVYIGNGKVIESTLSARGDGVVMTDIKDFKWEYWFKCPYISYTDVPKTEQHVEYRKVKFACNARREGKLASDFVKKYFPGEMVIVETDSEMYDKKSKFTYIKIYGKNEWIVKSAI